MEPRRDSRLRARSHSRVAPISILARRAGPWQRKLSRGSGKAVGSAGREDSGGKLLALLGQELLDELERGADPGGLEGGGRKRGDRVHDAVAELAEERPQLQRQVEGGLRGRRPGLDCL